VPSLDPVVADVRGAVRASLADLGPGARLLVACSGGPDSLALASATAFESRRSGWSVAAVVVDHGLQRGSAEIARRAAGTAAALGCEPVDVVAASVGSEGGPEAAARAARYDELGRRVPGVDAILLGHTRDDQAETVLLGLARGSGIRSVAGMRAHAGVYRRPLLTVPRAATHRYCDVLGIPVWHDPHNSDPRFRRVRVRAELVPVLDDVLGPRVTESLARTADLACRDADALDEWAARAREQLTGPDGGLEVAALAALPAAVSSRVIRAAAVDAGCPRSDLAAEHVDAVGRLVDDWHGQAGVDLPGRRRAVRRAGAISFVAPG
jgi:tRNA(Ile)-lysidine synthase